MQGLEFMLMYSGLQRIFLTHAMLPYADACTTIAVFSAV